MSMREASFEVQVSPDDITSFAEISGDWNPLHTSDEHARHTEFSRRVLHGAYSAGLLSRLAGMYIPGTDCLLTGMQLRFVAPIRPPVKLLVRGELKAEAQSHGRVEATISDAETGARYVDGTYEFGRHRVAARSDDRQSAREPAGVAAGDPVLVTGATGGLGRAVVERLGERAIPLARPAADPAVEAENLDGLLKILGDRRVGAVVHCGWPAPDNSRLIELPDARAAVDHNVAAPLTQAIALARLLARLGRENALLVLIGSTAAFPGRHGYRAPLYTLGKALVPELTRILALELASSKMRAAAIVFDVLEAGMNANLAPRARLAHVDRSPMGRLPAAGEAAEQIAWLLENSSFLVSGASITLTGGALP